MKVKPRNLGKTYIDKTGVRKFREWRGIKDTLYDYAWWCVMWKDMIKFVLKSPVQVVKGIFKYRWMLTYLSLPQFLDRQLEGMRGIQLKAGHILYDVIVKHTIDIIGTEFDADQKLGGDKALAERIICFDELVPTEIMAGFPNLIGIPVQTIPIFLSSMINQHISEVYLDSIENFGVPADVCPLPSAESGIAVEGDYPIFGKCFISCNMPCDGSVMTSAYQDRYFKLPTYCLGVPLRYNDEVDAQEYAIEEIKGCIAFIEEQTGEKFDWAAFKTAMDKYNEVTQFHFDLWDINRTDYPQVTGNVPWLYRMYSFHLHGGMDDRFLKADDKVRKLMEDGYKKKLPCTLEMRHKALVWSCPANYYTNFSNWLEQCWGIVSVMDMETHVGNVMVDTSTQEGLLLGLAQLYQRTTMRKHTKGGYKNALNEMWSIADAFNCDTIIMYDQISCKGMDGLQGMFDEQARERNINFIWVQQDLMDPRTISRRDMRNQVNSYMTSVLREEPLDPTLVDFDDCDAF
ncbi:MAG: 2-hydroxyacyl-CoA dehydratase family protein [Clostridiales bacterium]|nr:2-hydroxyacyl-CoA dehydratase family protein [Clostridiales bacterium]MDY2908916.1 2-hydroxyacyl-CoA dehydratase family protein [Oscillospiraceae bacterium]